MGKMKKGCSFLLALAVFCSVTWFHAGNAAGSDTETGKMVVPEGDSLEIMSVLGTRMENEPEEQEKEAVQVQSFPYEGYVWGKDSERKDTGLSARLIGEAGGKMRRAPAGSAVVITPGTFHRYGTWSTCEFTVNTSSGQYLGYCAQPKLSTPNGTYTVSELDNDMIKAALLIAPGGVPEMYEDYGKNIYNEKDNNVYAYAHALIGYLYMGSLTGLSSSMAAGIQNMAAVLAHLISTEPSSGQFQSYFRQYKAFVADTGSPDLQDIVWLERSLVGYARLRKCSANPEITDGNSCYSLAGARYGVFEDNGCTRQAAVLTTDASGNSDTANLEEGLYYVKEITAPQGYVLDSKIYPIQVSAVQTAELNVSDEPVTAPIFSLYKIDRETGGTSALGAASLENTRFRVNFYSGYYTKDSLPDEFARSWVIETGPAGADRERIGRTEEGEGQHKVSGDEFYRIGDRTALPLGTLSVEEIQAPVGYQLDSTYLVSGDRGGVTEAVHVARIIRDGDQGIVEDGMEYLVADSVIRGDIALTKLDKNRQQPMARIPFRITSNTTGESHVIMTDENGCYSSSAEYAAHSFRTNGGSAGDGLWFGLDGDGRNVPVDDRVGALPYDTYRIEELDCAANKRKILYSGTFTIAKAGETVNLGNIENVDIMIRTTARDKVTGTHYALAGDAAIVDTVSYIGLSKGKTYRLAGTLVNRITGRTVMDKDGEPVSVSHSFVPKDSDGEVEVEFVFDASGLAGADIVVYEELYLGTEKLVEHADIDDGEQTIHFPRIWTTVLDDETVTHQSMADEEVCFTDRVSYENLAEGCEYRLTGRVVDQETGEPMLDDGGKPVTAEVSFVAEEPEGEVQVPFRLSGTDIAGKTAVVFETLAYEENLVAEDENIENGKQSIYFPEIRTNARDKADGDQELLIRDMVIVTDRVEYRNLIPGEEYKVAGTIMEKDSGKELVRDGGPVAAEYVFVAKEASGSVEVDFTFQSSGMEEKELVVFEKLYMTRTRKGGNENQNEKEVARHEDLEDPAQTVRLVRETVPSQPATGDSAGRWVEACLLLLAGSFLVIFMSAILFAVNFAANSKKSV